MVEVGVKPVIKIVAALTVRGSKGRASAGVRGIRGVLPVLKVAGIALGGETVKDSRSELFVALVALHGRVSAKKREAILMILDLLDGNVPALNGVTLRAVGTHLPAVNIGVAIRTILAYVGEDRLGVARDAFHLFMHAAKGIGGFVVVEFRNGTDRAPGSRSVAVFTGDRERTVGISRGFLLRGAARKRGRMRQHPRRTAGGKGKERPECELE